jgi:hypothetical protein
MVDRQGRANRDDRLPRCVRRILANSVEKLDG